MVGRHGRGGETRGFRGSGILRLAGRLAVALSTLCLILAGAPASSLAAGSTFYADQFGTGSACTQASPCSLSTALSAAGDGDTVQVASGNYGFANTTTQYTITHAITIQGVSGVSDTGAVNRPVLFSNSGPLIDVKDPGGTVTLRDLTLTSTSSSNSDIALRLDSAATVQRVQATSPNGTACRVTADAVSISDSLCDSINTGAHGIGIELDETNGPMTVTLHGDTIIEAGTNYGMIAQAVFGSLTVNVTNTIITSANVSISPFASAAGSSAIVNLDHSNYNASQIFDAGGGGTTQVNSGTGDQTASAPQFRDTANHDYHEAATSPTVNAGTPGASGPLDLDGNDRSYGGGTDIGAYEYLPAPTASLGSPQPEDTTAIVNGTVSPNGVDTHYQFVYSTDPNLSNATTTTPVDAGSGTTPVAASVNLTGLQPSTTYYYVLGATSAGGVDETAIGTFTTTATAPGLVIQSLRLSGLTTSDQYVDLYNPTTGAVNLTGWQLAYPGTAVSLPATNVPTQSHYLIAGSGYSLDSYAPADLTAAGLNIPSDSGVQLIAPDAAVTDAVGMSTAPAGYSSGTGLAAPASWGQVAFERKYSAGKPVNTSDNASDFQLVANDGDTNDHSASAVLGAPHPLDLASPLQRNDIAQSNLFDTTKSASVAPNRVYDAGTGTLTVRRTIKNASATQTITSLRLLLTTITTYGDVTGSQAILVARSSTSETVNGKSVEGITLDAPPSATNSGGLDSSLTAPLPSGGLAPGQSVNVDIVFHVARGGSFSFGYNAEATTG